MKDLAKLPFATKLKLIEKVAERHPEFKDRYFDGEVPISWLLSQEEIETLIKEVKVG